MAHIPCVHVILGDVHKPHHFRYSRIHITSRCITSTLRASGLQDFPCFHTSNSPKLCIIELANLLPCVLLDRTTKIHLGYSPVFHGSAPCALLNVMVEAYFGSSDFGNLKFQNLFGPIGFYPKPWI
jgi:hypothetical protein